jgi:hypothetical protein
MAILPRAWRLSAALGGAAGRQKVEMPSEARYYPDVIDEIIYPGNIPDSK